MRLFLLFTLFVSVLSEPLSSAAPPQLHPSPLLRRSSRPAKASPDLTSLRLSSPSSFSSSVASAAPPEPQQHHHRRSATQSADLAVKRNPDNGRAIYDGPAGPAFNPLGGWATQLELSTLEYLSNHIGDHWAVPEVSGTPALPKKLGEGETPGEWGALAGRQAEVGMPMIGGGGPPGVGDTVEPQDAVSGFGAHGIMGAAGGDQGFGAAVAQAKILGHQMDAIDKMMKTFTGTPGAATQQTAPDNPSAQGLVDYSGTFHTPDGPLGVAAGPGVAPVVGGYTGGGGPMYYPNDRWLSGWSGWNRGGASD